MKKTFKFLTIAIIMAITFNTNIASAQYICHLCDSATKIINRTPQAYTPSDTLILAGNEQMVHLWFAVDTTVAPTQPANWKWYWLGKRARMTYNGNLIILPNNMPSRTYRLMLANTVTISGYDHQGLPILGSYTKGGTSFERFTFIGSSFSTTSINRVDSFFTVTQIAGGSNPVWSNGVSGNSTSYIIPKNDTSFTFYVLSNNVFGYRDTTFFRLYNFNFEHYFDNVNSKKTVCQGDFTKHKIVIQGSTGSNMFTISQSDSVIVGDSLSYTIFAQNRSTRYTRYNSFVDSTNINSGIYRDYNMSFTYKFNSVPKQTYLSSTGSEITCAANAKTLNAKAGYSYVWFKDNAALTNDTVQSYNAIAPGTYYVVYTSSEGCVSNSLTYEKINENLTVDFTYGIVGRTVSFTNTSDDKFNNAYTWDFNDGNSSLSVDPVNTYAADGTYNVKMDVVSQLGCAYSKSKSIVINTTGIASAKSMNVVGIYPNPATDYIKVDGLVGSYNVIELATGRVMASGDYMTGGVIDVSVLKSGVYVVVFDGGYGRFVK